MREQMLEFAECMRDHGIDMPDPVFGDDGRVDDAAPKPGERVGSRRDDDEEFKRPPARRAAASGGAMIDRRPTRGRGRVMARWMLLAGGTAVAVAGGRRRRRRRCRRATTATGRPTADGDDADRRPSTLVDVVRRDLARTEELDGTVGYGDRDAARARRRGHADRRSPTAGDVIDAGRRRSPRSTASRSSPSAGRLPLWRDARPGRRRRRRRAGSSSTCWPRWATPRTTT